MIPVSDVTVQAMLNIQHCKSRIFRMHFIFLYFVRGGFHTKIKCILKIQSKSENPWRSAAVLKFHAYERSGVPSIQKFSAYEISGFTLLMTNWEFSSTDEWDCQGFNEVGSSQHKLQVYPVCAFHRDGPRVRVDV